MELLKQRTFEFINQWEQLDKTKKLNWLTITPIQIEYDNDYSIGYIDFTIVVLGVGFTVGYIKDEEDYENEKSPEGSAKEYS